MKQTIKTIERELDIINRQIDMKIITGRSYKHDAMRHKSLLAELRQLKSRGDRGFFSGFLGGMAKAVTSFIF